MTHKFQVQNKSKLDSPKRREMLNPDKILSDLISLKEGKDFLDIGCGIGYFAIPAAKILGDSGLVYALDTEKEMLRDVEEKAKSEKLENIRIINSQEYHFPIEDSVGKKALISLVLHEITDKDQFLKECRRKIGEEGTLFILEWKKEESDWGPPIDHRVSSKEIEALLEKNKFKEVHTLEINEYYYLTSGIV